jgi:hypothetical protein
MRLSTLSFFARLSGKFPSIHCAIFSAQNVNTVATSLVLLSKCQRGRSWMKRMSNSRWSNVGPSGEEIDRLEEV